MQDYEKLGAFYLGTTFDVAAGKRTEDLVLYDSKDLTTHAVVVGMTGSGKTGLGVSILEEAAIDGIPALVIDPKGDLGNLLLAFPELQASDFRPWIDEAEAGRKGLAPDAYSVQTAETWKKGLGEWGQDAARVGRYKNAVEMAIYTPGCSTGRPLSILSSFAAPPPAVAADTSALRERIQSAVSGLLGLLGIEADPIQSREHILLSTILGQAWAAGQNLDIAGIILAIQKPAFDKVGVFDLESFYPAKERMGLAMALNNLLASPGFSAWMEGEPLDVQRLLYTAEGKPRLSILSIAHLSDSERMFFVTILLNEVLSWMRSQSGTSSLRAMLYMDEIYGYFPPSAMPPSKTPMLTLLKQARAFGLGIVLATQNPVDLDYKGLANAGTWFIGRLQTERDKARVIEGLAGALSTSGASEDRAAMEKMFAALGNRVFLMRNVHEDQPVLFQTRWALSYLRGPMTLPQIQTLMKGAKTSPAAGPVSAAAAAPVAAVAPSPAPAGGKPIVPPDVAEFFLRPKTAASGELTYKPGVVGVSRLHYVDSKAAVDLWDTMSLIADISDDGREALWSEANRYGDLKPQLDRQGQPGARYGELPGGSTNAKNYAAWSKALGDFLYQNITMELMQCPALKLTSQPGEAEGDFSARLQQKLREVRDEEVEKLRKKYAPKLTVLQDRIRRAGERVQREQAQFGQQKMQTVISVGATLLGAFLGRKAVSVGNIGRATTAMKSASRIGREKEDVARAGENMAVLQEQLAALQGEFDAEVARVQGEMDPALAEIQKVQIRPRKSDVSVVAIGLVWVPWGVGADGAPQPV